MALRFLTLLAGLLALASPAASQAPAPTPVPSLGIADDETSDDGPHRNEHYPGAQFFFRLQDVTVVYPSGEGQDLTTNRLSAEARAAALAGAGVATTRAVADKELTDADRSGNLLILGWTNAAFNPPVFDRAFDYAGGKLTFLGLTIADPDLDLMIFNRNPFNPKSFVLFWSRIDPEMDRFMPLPRVGSDWAVFREFRPLLQGMFVPGGAWPPVRDDQAQADHRETLAAENAKTRSASSEHYAVRYDADRVKAPELEQILRAREAAFAKAAERLGNPAFDSRIQLAVFEDEETKKRMTGVDDPAHSIPRSLELFMTRRAARSSAPHEEYHLVARKLLGPAYLSSLYEALAFSLDGVYKGMDLEVAAALLARQAAVPKLEALISERTFRALPEEVTVPLSGLFVTWLRKTLPPESFARVYGARDGSTATIAKAAGRPWADLEAGFAAWLAERAAARASDVAFLQAQSEAKSRYAASDYAGLAAALKKALSYRPDDPQTLFNLASAQMRLEAYAEAEANLKRVLALPLAAKDSQFLVFGRYQLGRVYDLVGRREDALAEYRKVLELPDQSDSHRLAHERIESPATTEQLE